MGEELYYTREMLERDKSRISPPRIYPHLFTWIERRNTKNSIPIKESGSMNTLEKAMKELFEHLVIDQECPTCAENLWTVDVALHMLAPRYTRQAPENIENLLTDADE